MTSKELNEKIRKLADNESFVVNGLSQTGKCIPYFGWSWREIDFDRDTYEFGIADGPTGFAGFMEDNKWDFEYANMSKENCKKLREMLEKAVVEPDNDELQAIFDFIQENAK